jgi:hypothetical protein
MPRAFPNAYAYQSPIGQGLHNIAQMLLADDGGARAAVMAAQGQAHQAQAAKYRADAEQTAYQTDQSRNFLNNAARNLLGQNGEQGLRFIQGATDYIPAREDEARQMTMAPTTAPVQRPANMDDNTERTLRQLAVLATAAGTNGGMNMDNLAKSISEMNKGSAYQGVLDGSVDPSRYMIASEKPLYHFGEGYAGNVATGAQNLNELGKAKVGTERAHQSAYGASANASNANARQSDRTNLLVEIPNPLDPTTKIKVPASTLYSQMEANKRNTDSIAGRKDVAELRNPDGTPQKIIKASQADRNAIGNSLSTLLASEDGFPIDPNDPAMAILMEKALASYSTPGNPGYLNDRAAARLAVDALSATGTQEGNWNPFKSNKTKLSIVPPSQRVEDQGVATPAPSTSGPVRVNTPADAAKLAPGTQYTTPDGRLFVR